MAAEDLSRLDATAQAELVRDGEATPVELVDAAIERIEAVNPEINAVITPLFEKAREAAAGELPDGPFRGVPILLKDLRRSLRGRPVPRGHEALRDLDWRETTDTWLVERFREAGFVICGKTNTPELGHPRHHRARGLRRHQQPLGHRTLAWRLERRIRGGGRCGHGAGRPRAATAAARSASRRRPAGSSG